MSIGEFWGNHAYQAELVSLGCINVNGTENTSATISAIENGGKWVANLVSTVKNFSERCQRRYIFKRWNGCHFWTPWFTSNHTTIDELLQNRIEVDIDRTSPVQCDFGDKSQKYLKYLLASAKEAYERDMDCKTVVLAWNLENPIGDSIKIKSSGKLNTIHLNGQNMGRAEIKKLFRDERSHRFKLSLVPGCTITWNSACKLDVVNVHLKLYARELVIV
jgi:hypothetical protein